MNSQEQLLNSGNTCLNCLIIPTLPLNTSILFAISFTCDKHETYPKLILSKSLRNLKGNNLKKFHVHQQGLNPSYGGPITCQSNSLPTELKSVNSQEQLLNSGNTCMNCLIIPTYRKYIDG